MGRLFWKFFFFIWVAQLCAIAGVSSMVWLKNRAAAERTAVIAMNPAAVFAVGSAAATLQFGGIAGLRQLLDSPESHRSFGVHAVDETGRELLGRDEAPALVDAARQMVDDEEGPRGVQQVRAADGHSYVLFVPRTPRPEGAPPPRHERRLFPVEPMAAGVLVSLIFAFLLARYISQPIRGLRGAFEAVAAGNLAARAAPVMGRRRDELADLGRDFDAMAERLGKLIEGQRRLLHDVSHEMRSPLARMQAAIGLARQQPEKLLATLDRVERETERIDTLVGELLTLARLQASPRRGDQGTREEAVSLNELTADIVDDARFEAEADGRSVGFEAGPEAVIQGQPELLHRAIENVVRNAVKHTAAGSSVDVATTLIARDAESAPGNAPPAGAWRLRVSDHGPGVPAAELAAIFEPFFRGGASTGDGHGLGLAIAKRVVETHGGSIAAANRPAGGLTVEIVLPIRAQAVRTAR
jgi:two-component system OmpR family sensor kinase